MAILYEVSTLGPSYTRYFSIPNSMCRLYYPPPFQTRAPLLRVHRPLEECAEQGQRGSLISQNKDKERRGLRGEEVLKKISASLSAMQLGSKVR